MHRQLWECSAFRPEEDVKWEMTELFENVGTIQAGGIYAALWAHQSGGFLGETADAVQ